MMSEDEVRGLLAVMQERDDMKILNTDAARGLLYVILQEDWPAKK